MQLCEKSTGTQHTKATRTRLQTPAEHVPKVIASMKCDPLHIVVEHDAAGHEKLCEADVVNPFGEVGLEVDPTVHQELDGLWCIHVLSLIHI